MLVLTLAWTGDRADIRALRSLLKTLVRRHGLRCIGIATAGGERGKGARSETTGHGRFFSQVLFSEFQKGFPTDGSVSRDSVRPSSLASLNYE